jgi:two-component system chemotaxis family response regulator WspR
MRLKFELCRAVQSRVPLTLVICDVDRFKRCNDMYGHVTGDALLVGVANLLKQYCRTGADLPARYGGDEFALLWPGVAQNASRRLTDELRTRVRDLRVRHLSARGANHVTVSFGVTTFSGLGSCTPSRFLRSADDALYRAKRAGRDRAVFTYCGGRSARRRGRRSRDA